MLEWWRKLCSQQRHKGFSRVIQVLSYKIHAVPLNLPPTSHMNMIKSQLIDKKLNEPVTVKHEWNSWCNVTSVLRLYISN